MKLVEIDKRHQEDLELIRKKAKEEIDKSDWFIVLTPGHIIQCDLIKPEIVFRLEEAKYLLLSDIAKFKPIRD